MCEIKYFNIQQIKALRKYVREQAELDQMKGRTTNIRGWMLIDLLTSSGLRAAEASDIRCGDLHFGYGLSELFVRNGKGQRSRTVQIPDNLKAEVEAITEGITAGTIDTGW